MMFFIIGFICGFGTAVVWALTMPKEKKNATYTTEDDDKDDPFRTW